MKNTKRANCATNSARCAASTTSVNAVSTPKGMYFWSPDYCEAGAQAYVRTPRGGYVMNDCQVDVFEPFKHENHRACIEDYSGDLWLTIATDSVSHTLRSSYSS